MSRYLAFDFDRMTALRSALRHADQALAAIHSIDPEALDAIASVRRATTSMPPWLALVDAVCACGALEDDGHWDTAQLHAAATALAALASDADWAATLWESFDHWQAWCRQLGEQRAEAVDALARPLAPDRAAMIGRVTAIDATFAALARTLVAEHAGNPASDLATVLRNIEPYSAALLLPYVEHDPVRLAQLAFELVARWCDRAPGLMTPGLTAAPIDAVLAGDNAADLVFRHLLSVPGAPAAYVALAAQRPDTLFSAAADTELARRVLVAGTDPAAVTPVAAGTVIVPILSWFAADDGRSVTAQRVREHSVGEDWRPVLAETLAPWLLHLSPLDRTWPGDAEQRRDAVAYVLEDPRALRALTGATDAAAAGLTASLATDGARAPLSLEELAAFVGMLSQLAADRQVHDAEASNAAWDLWWRLGDVALDAVHRPVLGSGVRLAFTQAHEYARRHGLLGAPTPAASVRAEVEQRHEWMLTAVGASVVDAAFRQLVTAGQIPPGAPPPPVPDAMSRAPQLTYERQYLDWRSKVFDGPADPRALAIDAVKSPFLSAADAGRSVAT